MEEKMSQPKEIANGSKEFYSWVGRSAVAVIITAFSTTVALSFMISKLISRLDALEAWVTTRQALDRDDTEFKIKVENNMTRTQEAIKRIEEKTDLLLKYKGEK